MNFSEIKNYCDRRSKISADVIDVHLLYYAADCEKFVPYMDAQIKKYKQASRELHPSSLNIFKSEFIAHRLFKKDGLVHRYLQHSEIKKLPAEQFEFLQANAAKPWRYCFAQLLENAENEFFKMLDVFTGEEFLLYSRSIQQTLREMNPRLWFLLISDNGMCCQTFGMVVPLNSFLPDDIYFFGTEINPDIDSDEKLMNEVEKNPFPFFMLSMASSHPIVRSNDHEMRIYLAYDDDLNVDARILEKDFEIDFRDGVYKLALRNLSELPHFAIAYYDTHENSLLRTAFTADGFYQLTAVLENIGLALNEDPEISVSPTMINTAGKILNKKIQYNPFDKLFANDKNQGKDEALKKVNQFTQKLVLEINSGKEIDIKKLADEAGIEEKTANQLYTDLKETLGRTKG